MKMTSLKEIPRAFVESIPSKTAKDMRTQIAERAKSWGKKNISPLKMA